MYLSLGVLINGSTTFEWSLDSDVVFEGCVAVVRVSAQDPLPCDLANITFEIDAGNATEGWFKTTGLTKRDIDCIYYAKFHYSSKVKHS